jgi:hypothetical protein
MICEAMEYWTFCDMNDTFTVALSERKFYFIERDFLWPGPKNGEKGFGDAGLAVPQGW